MNTNWIIGCLLSASLLLSACTQQQDKDLQAIEALEAQLTQKFEQAAADSLLVRYSAYERSYPADSSRVAAYRFASARLLLQLQRYESSANRLLELLRARQGSAAAAQLLAEIYETKLDQPQTALAVRQAMLLTWPQDSVSQQLSASLSGIQPVQARLDTLLLKLVSPDDGSISYLIADAYMQQAEAFAAVAGPVDLSARLLYKAAEIARALQAYPRAIANYQWIVQQFPGTDWGAKASFMMAFTYDEDLKQLELARKAYEAFLAAYPNDPFAGDAAMLLDNLGKSDAEIMEKFQQ
jgi:tetratricopeptide (TPR) repeat protein